MTNNRDLENLNDVEVIQELPTDVVASDEVTSVLSMGEEGKAQSVKEVINECVKTENLLTEEANKVVEKEGYSTVIIITVIIAYLLGDILKNIMDRKAVSETGVNHAVLPAVYAVLNIVLAFCVTLFFEGQQGVKSLFKWESLKLFAIPAFFFACSQGVGLLVSKYLDAGAKKVLNQLRIPMTALIGRFIMGSSYSTLQWLGMTAVLAGCACFHFLTQEATSEDNAEAQKGMMLGVVFLVFQNILAVVGSLFAEKFLKSQKKNAFYKQKFQIEIWGFLSSILMWVVIMPYVMGGILSHVTGDVNEIHSKEVTALRARFVTSNIAREPKQLIEFQETAFEIRSIQEELQTIYPKAEETADRFAAQEEFVELSKKIAHKDLNGKNITLLKELEDKAAELADNCKKIDVENKNEKKVCTLKYKFVRAAIKFENVVKFVNSRRNFQSAVQTFATADVTTKSADLTNKINFFFDEGLDKIVNSDKEREEYESIQKLCKEMTAVELKVDQTECGNYNTFKKYNTNKRIAVGVFTKDTKNPKIYMQDGDYKLEIVDTKTDKATISKTTISYCDNEVDVSKVDEKDSKSIGDKKNAEKCDDKKWVEYVTCDTDVTEGLKTDGQISIPKDVKCTQVDEEEQKVIVFAGKHGYGVKVKGGKICDPKTCGDQVITNKVDDKDINNKYFYQTRAFTSSPFYGFELIILCGIIANLLQSWMSGLISKVLSSLMKNIFGAVATALIVVCEIFMGVKSNTVPIYSAIAIVILTALVFGQIPKPKKN